MPETAGKDVARADPFARWTLRNRLEGRSRYVCPSRTLSALSSLDPKLRLSVRQSNATGTRPLNLDRAYSPSWKSPATSDLLEKGEHLSEIVASVPMA